MKDLMKSNIYDCSNKIIIVGSCLKAMQPKAFEELEFTLILNKTENWARVTFYRGKNMLKEVDGDEK